MKSQNYLCSVHNIKTYDKFDSYIYIKTVFVSVVHVLVDLKHLPEGNSSKRWWPGCVESLVIVLVLPRYQDVVMPFREGGGQPVICSAVGRPSAELFYLKQSNLCTTLRCSTSADSWWSPGRKTSSASSLLSVIPPEHSEEVDSLLCSLDGHRGVGSPGEVLGDEDSQEFEGLYPLHADLIYAVGPGQRCISPEVLDDLFGFCGVQWEVVQWTLCCQALYLIPVCRLVSPWDEPHDCCVISKFDEEVQHWAQHVFRVIKEEICGQSLTHWGQLGSPWPRHGWKMRGPSPYVNGLRCPRWLY